MEVISDISRYFMLFKPIFNILQSFMAVCDCRGVSEVDIFYCIFHPEVLGCVCVTLQHVVTSFWLWTALWESPNSQLLVGLCTHTYVCVCLCSSVICWGNGRPRGDNSSSETTSGWSSGLTATTAWRKGTTCGKKLSLKLPQCCCSKSLTHQTSN